MAKEYWIVDGDVVGVSDYVPAVFSHYVFPVAYICTCCGKLWAMRLVEEEPGIQTVWTAYSQSSCPQCHHKRPRKMFKLIQYKEAVEDDYMNIPTAILALEFLWLYMANHGEVAS